MTTIRGAGMTIARIIDDGVTEDITYIHTDHLGSTSTATDTSGAVLWREHHSPFGEALNPQAENDNLAAFTGHIRDADTGLTYMQARYYDPVGARFLSIDPVTFMDKPFPGQFNRYAYTWNDPVNATDPNGEFLKVVKSVYNVGKRTYKNGGNFKGALKDEAMSYVENGATLFDPNASAGDKIFAVFDLATGFGDEAKGVKKLTSKKTCCFVAGTLVETQDGLRPIEDIEVGDLVLAKDEETGEIDYKPVVGLIRLHDRVIWDLIMVTESGATHTFHTTDDHPWWVKGHGWKRTDELTSDDILATQANETVRVKSVANTTTVKPTFNFEVADFNTYFVGESRVWVHNARKCGFTPTAQNEIRRRNQQAGGGVEHCVDCGVVVTRQKGPNQKDQKIASDRSEVDHDTPLADGGSND